jgi:hypothetical protein
MGHRLYFKVKAISVAVLFLVSCNDVEDCIKGTGEVMLEERPVGFYDGITVSDDINLVILNDTARNLVVEAGENLLPEISTECFICGMIMFVNIYVLIRRRFW